MAQATLSCPCGAIHLVLSISRFCCAKRLDGGISRRPACGEFVQQALIYKSISFSNRGCHSAAVCFLYCGNSTPYLYIYNITTYVQQIIGSTQVVFTLCAAHGVFAPIVCESRGRGVAIVPMKPRKYGIFAPLNSQVAQKCK